jgi:membrane-bound lytic murein transglycosylase D
MRVDNIVDQRYDPYYATQAAAVFLKENFETLGSWPMAITAYNHGRNGMLRAAKKYGGYEQIFNNHATGMFKFASRNFYSEFIAATNVARRLENDKSIIPDRPEATIMVRMEGFARAEDIRSHFRLSEEDFSRLNPALRKPVLTGEKYIPKNYYVRIPANARTRDLASIIPSALYRHSQVRDKEYIVRRGDTVGAIARKYKISAAELVIANNLNGKAMIRMGQKLIIPTKADNKNRDQVTILESSSKNKPH